MGKRTSSPQGFVLHRLYNAARLYYLLQETNEPENSVYREQVRSEMFAALLECQLLQAEAEPRWRDAGQIHFAFTEEGVTLQYEESDSG